MEIMRRLVQEEEGQGMVEYALIIGINFYCWYCCISATIGTNNWQYLLQQIKTALANNQN